MLYLIGALFIQPDEFLRRVEGMDTKHALD